MSLKILCRADGNSIIGLGHMYRIFSIIEFYKDTFEVIFLTRETSTLKSIPQDYTTRLIPEHIVLEQEATWIKEQYSSKNIIIVADGYQFDSTYQKQIKSQGFQLIYIDDLMSEHMFADIVVNHSPFAKEEHFKSENYTKFALGTSYAMLRPKFNRLAQLENNFSTIKEVFVCFGGADPYNLSYKAASALLQIEKIKQVHVVLGGAYNHSDIYDLEQTSQNLKLYSNLDEEHLSLLMKKCQLGIAPSSTILYELCAVKMPILSGYYVENQKYIYRALSDRGIVFKGDDFSNYSIADFKLIIEAILNKNDFSGYLNQQKQLIDGFSKTRFLGLIHQLNLKFRKVNLQDAKLVFDWSNEPVVRQFSFNSEPLIWENHLEWFSKKIKDKNTLFLIAEVNNKPAGVVRYEINENHAVVGILIDKIFRGQKLAPEFLKQSAELYFKNYNIPIWAYIKKENKASIKSFENARYMYIKEEIIKGNVSFVYKLEK